MKSFLNVYRFVCGSWESITTQPGRRFYPGTARLIPAKSFPASDRGIEKAKAFAEQAGATVFRVVRYDPPVPPSRTWGQTELFSTETTATP